MDKPIAVVIGATSKWQSDGSNTKLAFGSEVDDRDIPPDIRWGAGGGIARRFAREGFFVALTTRRRANAARLLASIEEEGGSAMIVELELSKPESISSAFAEIRRAAGDPQVVIYNVGYQDGRELPAGMELLENIPMEIFEKALHLCGRGPLLVAKEVLPAMRKRGSGALFFTNNRFSLRGLKRQTGQSLYYPRTLMRTLAQVLTEEYTQFGVHIAHVILDGAIDSPGIRLLPTEVGKPTVATEEGRSSVQPKRTLAMMNPARIADAFYFLYMQDRCCWTHELQLTPYTRVASY